MARDSKHSPTPEQIQQEYLQGVEVKRNLGEHGLIGQSRINERFYSGDQWYGAACGDSRPLVRHNVIKRIGDYKMAVVGAAPVSVRFAAEGVADTPTARGEADAYRHAMSQGETAALPQNPAARIRTQVEGLTAYFATTAKRLRLDYLKQAVLRNAYISGTGVLYTYWDPTLPTGQFADEAGTAPICGDIVTELLEIEQVYMGDPTLEDIRQQPYVLIAQRQPVSHLQGLARSYGCREAAGIKGDEEAERSGHATLLTRFWKQANASGQVTVHAMQVCGNVVVRPVWDMGLTHYPLAVFRWDEKRHSAYGESEIPYLIPNQIAINRTVSAGVWAVMMMGMPIMLVNGDVVTQPITNDPGQVIPVYGSGEEVDRAVRYVDPPAFSAQLDANVQHLISDTMTQAGVSSTLLGDVEPNNAAAIIAVREASLMPLQMLQNRFYAFLEEVAHIWVDFWLTMYGCRGLRVDGEEGCWYMPFDSAAARRLLPALRVEVGTGEAYSEANTMETLDNLYKNGIITARQYLSRLPVGLVPGLEALLQEIPQ